MTIQQTHLVQELVERIRASQGATDTTVPTGVLSAFLKGGEQQLESLFQQIKSQQRELSILHDRADTQRDTIKKLQSEISDLQRKRK